MRRSAFDVIMRRVRINRFPAHTHSSDCGRAVLFMLEGFQ